MRKLLLTGAALLAVAGLGLLAQRNDARALRDMRAEIEEVRGLRQQGSYESAQLQASYIHDALRVYEKDCGFASRNEISLLRSNLNSALRTDSTNNWNYSLTYPSAKKN